MVTTFGDSNKASGKKREGLSLEVWGPMYINRYILDEDALERILLDSRVRDSKVMVVSVGGCSGSGNSFLLNIFLKYLKNPGNPDWMNNPSDPVEGFQWRFNCWFQNTRSIYLWSEPFFITTPSGEEVCVLLMDTRGYRFRPEEFYDFHLLNSLLASVQLFSLKSWNDIDKFKCVVNYGKAALEVYKTKPFQTLNFLVRDTKRYPPGFKGEENLLNYWLKEMKSDIPECFKDLHCFFMPNPGAQVQSENFRGLLSDEGINPEFNTCLKILTEHVFNPKNVVIKEINGKQVTGRELFHYFKSYGKALEQDNRHRNAYNETLEEALDMIEDEAEDVPYAVIDVLKQVKYEMLTCDRGYKCGYHFPKPSDMIEAADEERNMIAEAENVCSPMSWGLMETTNEAAWNVIAVDKAEDYYKIRMKELMSSADVFYVKEIPRANINKLSYLILKANHKICFKSAMKKLRRMGVVNKMCEDELKDRLQKLYDDFVKDVQGFEVDHKLLTLASEYKKMNSSIYYSIMAKVSEDKKKN